jgi:hypothetical protein
MLTLLLALVAGTARAGGIDLSDLPVPTNAAEAAAALPERRRRVLAYEAAQPMGEINFQNGSTFADVGVAKLELGMDIDAVNQAILRGKAYSLPGTDFHDFGTWCSRNGDYDFFLRALTAMVTRHWDKLYPETKNHLIRELLTVKGGHPVIAHTFHCIIDIAIPETENHILMTESSRMLTNQLNQRWLAEQGRKPEPRFDNERNGMNAWMLKHLQGFLKDDFFEYNSRPYQPYSVMAIENLFQYADDARVRLAARMVLDYLAGKFAVSSNHLRRQVPFRRQPVYRGLTDMLVIDGETPRWLYLTGDTSLIPGKQAIYSIGFMAIAAVTDYQPPAFLVDLMLKPEAYFERFHHTGIELYAGSPSFLITAGGVWSPALDFFTHVNSGWQVATTVMPTKGGVDASEFIGFDGGPDWFTKVNNCIAPGFACGINPILPESIPSDCLTQVRDRDGRGMWTFVDFTAASCPLQYGFYVAQFSAPCDHLACKARGSSYGFLEASEPVTDFETFRSTIIDRNWHRHFSSRGRNEYVTTDGRYLQFEPLTGSMDWGMIDAGRGEAERNLHRWPLASGEVMSGDGKGFVTLTRPSTGERLVLDYTDALNPWRSPTN